MNELVSVIVPVYNVERYLKDCVNSVLSQTYKNYELLLIDDGSTDASGLICDEFSKSNHRVRSFHKENGGLSSARNLGLEQINADSCFIFFLDSDDFVSADLLSDLVNAMETENADMVICAFSNVNVEGKDAKKIEDNIFEDGVNNKGEIINKSVGYNGWMYRLTWNKLYRRELFDGIRFDEHKIHEDELIAYKLLLKCNRITCLGNSLYYYRNTQGSIMSAAYSTQNLSLLEAHLLNSRLLAENNFPEASRKIYYRAVLEYCHAYSELTSIPSELKRQNKECAHFLYQRRVLSFLVYVLLNFACINPKISYKVLSDIKNRKK